MIIYDKKRIWRLCRDCGKKFPKEARTQKACKKCKLKNINAARKLYLERNKLKRLLTLVQ